MRPGLHLIFGPTTTGKTGRSVVLAKETGAPVVAIDRIQCHSELSVGSGRPSVEELDSTRRLYLCDRPVVAGELPPAQANALLHELVLQIGLSDSLILLEGGSISLLRAIATDISWNEYKWTYERWHLPAWRIFNGKASGRVRKMLTAGVNGSMLDEIAALWPDKRSHAVLMGIVGYRTIIDDACRSGIPVTDLAKFLTSADIDRLTDAIVSDFFAYAQWQEREFSLFPSALPQYRDGLWCMEQNQQLKFTPLHHDESVPHAEHHRFRAVGRAEFAEDG